jgi:hypothetical protein
MLRYSEAEERLKQSILIRASCLQMHDYPGRGADRKTIQNFHNDFGIPPMGFIRRTAWWVVKR